MTQLKDGGRQPSNREERSLSASTVIARWQGKGWDEPCKSRGLRTVLWAAGGEIPPADPAISQPGTAVSVGACDDLRSLPAAAPSHGRSRLSTRTREGLPDLATGDLRPSSSVMARYRPPIARTRLRIG